MKSAYHFHLLFAVQIAALVLVTGCARAPQDPNAWQAASEQAARQWIKTDPHLISRLGEVTDISAPEVQWDKVRTDRVLFWRDPLHTRLVNTAVNGPRGKFELQIMTQGRGDQAQVIYWAWSTR